MDASVCLYVCVSVLCLTVDLGVAEVVAAVDVVLVGAVEIGGARHVLQHREWEARGDEQP